MRTPQKPPTPRLRLVPDPTDARPTPPSNGGEARISPCPNGECPGSLTLAADGGAVCPLCDATKGPKWVARNAQSVRESSGGRYGR